MKKLIIPRAGVQVRRPDGKPLKAEGEPLDYSAYWVRRKDEGDVTIQDLPTEDSPKATKEKKS